MTVIRVFAEGKRPRPNSEFKTGTYKGWNFEAYNISWLPADFMENPHLCVFNGVGSRLFASGINVQFHRERTSACRIRSSWR
jgi:hypothetical protein